MDKIGKNLGKTIKNLREERGFSQEKLAKLLLLQRPTISQIENGERKVSLDEIIKLSDLFGISVETFLGLKKSPQVVLNESSPSKKHTVSQIRINVPQKHVDKFKEVLLYILNKIGSKANIGETVIYKLLYFIDFDYYEKYEMQLIGASYMKNKYGPTPVEFKKIVDSMIGKEIEKVKSDYFNYPQTKYLPLRKAKISIFKAEEIELIDKVLHRLSDMNAAQISNYSHGDVPWLTTDENEIIEYESVFYRTQEYSVRDYGDELQSNKTAS